MKKILIFAIAIIAVLQVSNAQEVKKPSVSFKTGLGITAPDSLFSINFRFRMQNRVSYFTKDENDFSASEIEARVRRLRLRMDGFIVNPKLTYYVQLSFSRGDMDWNVRDNSRYNSSPNIVRDAVVFYRPIKNLMVSFGQTKLPGNRQRVVSSGELQFADRSIVNSTFNIDRDFGFQFAYDNNIGKFVYVLKGAVTSGEGRNSNISDYGLAYTGRMELLPFGKFTNKGDYFEGDLEREPKPKISLAGGYHYNESAQRAAGVLGRDLYKGSNLSSFISDFLFKYKGIAVSVEYMNRNATRAVTYNAAKTDSSAVYIGDGFMTQASYIFKNNIEIAGRYATVNPYKSARLSNLYVENYTLGLTKYLHKHRVKLQGNVMYEHRKDFKKDQHSQNWVYTFQIELGI